MCLLFRILVYVKHYVRNLNLIPFTPTSSDPIPYKRLWNARSDFHLQDIEQGKRNNASTLLSFQLSQREKGTIMIELSHPHSPYRLLETKIVNFKQ